MNKLIRLVAFTALFAAGAQAGNITITFDNPDQTGAPGDTLNFYGVITDTELLPATISDVPDEFATYLNGDSLPFTLSDAVVTDNFYANVPWYLEPGESSGDIDLFDITLADPETLNFGVYQGTYTVQGGMDGGDDSAQLNLAQADFSVDVEADSPEPGTLMLLGASLASIGLLRRRISANRQTR